MSIAGLQQAHRFLQFKQTQEAYALFERILQQGEFIADALNGMGMCLEQQGQFTLAEQSYRQVLAQAPDHLEALNNLAICLQAQKKLPQAIEAFEQLAQLVPQSDTHYNLAKALYLSQDEAFDWRALGILEQVLQKQPNHEASVFLVLNIAARWANRHQNELLKQLEHLLALHPESPIYPLALAGWYRTHKQNKLMMRYFKAALICEPRLTGIYRRLIHQFQREGNYQQAFDMACELLQQHQDLNSQFELLATFQEPVPIEAQHIEWNYQTLIKLVDVWQNNRPHAQQGYKPRPAAIPFYHCYQIEEDLTLQSKLASFYHRHLTQALSPFSLREKASPRPRLGVFSMHLYRHSVMDFLNHTVKNLLQSPEFETYLFYCTHPSLSKFDTLTQDLIQNADQAVSLEVDPWLALEQIADHQLDILVFLDIGMDAYSYILACHRLAKHQLLLPGHPVTTGLKTIDYFISSDLLESENPQSRYSEKVLQLPGLPCYLHPPVVEAVAADKLNLPQGNLYFCPMTLFKLSPDFDQALIRILELDSQACILILAYKNNLHERLYQRLVNTAPICKGRIYFLNWSDQNIFFQRLLAADVILDSFPFGGGNTSYQALNLGCPVVTLSQKAMKGRWTEAMYQQMQMPNLVAYTVEDYATLAVQVATHKDWQASLRQQIKERNHLIFDDPTWSNALHDLCVELVKNSVEHFSE